MADTILMERKQVEVDLGEIKINKRNEGRFKYRACNPSTKMTLTDKAMEVRLENNAPGRALIYKEINFGNRKYKTIKLNMNLTYRYPDFTYTGFFGVIKSRDLETQDNYDPRNAFIASTVVSNNATVDVSNIEGVHLIGAYGIFQGDVYSFEVLK